MASSTDSPPLTLATTNPSKVPLLPEVWQIVFQKSDNRTLKAARYVNSVFRDLCIPQLFDHAVFSIDQKTIRNLKALAKNQELAKHVKRLYIDTASYRAGLNTREYSQMTASYYNRGLGLPKQRESSPLSEQSLLKILRSDPLEDLGNKYLSGPVRKAYVTGFATYVARSDYFREQFEGERLYKHLKDIISCLPSLKHVETSTLWTTSRLENSIRDHFETYLRRNLPATTLKLIDGLKFREPLPKNTNPASNQSCYCGPGQTARRLHPLTPPPNFNGCWGDITNFELVSATMRAMHESKAKVETLILPGSEHLSRYIDTRDRPGVIPISALVTVPRSGTKISKRTHLLPLFQGLKNLELKIDFGHPGAGHVHQNHLDPLRLCNAMQQMSNIERLSFGAVHYPEEARADSWSLYESMLRSTSDVDILTSWKDSGNPEDILALAEQGDFNLPDGLEATVDPVTFAMLASSLGLQIPPGGQPAGVHLHGIAPLPATNPPSTPPPPAPATGPAATPSTGPTPTTSTPNTTPPNDDDTPKIHPSNALKPNPWPKLRRLHLFNMPATKEDLFRLVHTLAKSPNFTSLELDRVYLDDRLQKGSPLIPTPSPPRSYPFHDLGQHWIDIIELMGKSLHLKNAQFNLPERDFDYLFDLLTDEIEHLIEAGCMLDIDDAIGEYLVNKNLRVAGFVTHISDALAELTEAMEDEDDDDEDEGEGGVEDGAGDRSDESRDENEEMPDLI